VPAHRRAGAPRAGRGRPAVRRLPIRALGAEGEPEQGARRVVASPRVGRHADPDVRLGNVQAQGAMEGIPPAKDDGVIGIAMRNFFRVVRPGVCARPLRELAPDSRGVADNTRNGRGMMVSVAVFDLLATGSEGCKRSGNGRPDLSVWPMDRVGAIRQARGYETQRVKTADKRGEGKKGAT